MEATLWGDGIWANPIDRADLPSPITGTHNDRGDPALVDPEAGDYPIGAGSAAMDRGLDTGIPTDMDGDPRPPGGGYDLRADEYPGPDPEGF